MSEDSDYWISFCFTDGHTWIGHLDGMYPLGHWMNTPGWPVLNWTHQDSLSLTGHTWELWSHQGWIHLDTPRNFRLTWKHWTHLNCIWGKEPRLDPSRQHAWIFMMLALTGKDVFWKGCQFDRNIDLRTNSSTLPYCTGECGAPVPLVCYGVTCYNRITFPYQVPGSAVESIKYPWSIVDRTLSFWTLLYGEDTDTWDVYCLYSLPTPIQDQWHSWWSTLFCEAVKNPMDKGLNNRLQTPVSLSTILMGVPIIGHQGRWRLQLLRKYILCKCILGHFHVWGNYGFTVLWFYIYM